MQTVVYFGDIWKLLNLVLRSWLTANRSDFLIRCRYRVKVSNLEFDDLSGVLSPDRFLSTAMDSSLASYVKLHGSNRTMSSSSEEVRCLFFFLDDCYGGAGSE